MVAFFDTSVLIPVYYRDHIDHAASLRSLLAHNKETACFGAHSLAEVYCTLTGMPGSYRVSGDQALLFLASIRERLTTVFLSGEEYWQAMRACPGMKITGGTTYDAMLAACAIKANTDWIYTWNTNHFARLGPQIAARLKTPA